MCQKTQAQQDQTTQEEAGRESPAPVDPKMIGAAKTAKTTGAVKVSELPESPPVLGKCCGLDVHKKSCTAAIISDDKLPIVLEGLENNGQGIHQLYQRLVEEGCSTVVMESSLHHSGHPHHRGLHSIGGD